MSKNVLITGAGQGIGRVTAGLLLSEGYKLYILEKDKESLDDLQTEFKGKDFIAIHCDIGNKASLVEAVNKIFENEKSFYGLINNAAIGMFKPLQELMYEEWQEVLNINLTAPFLLSKLLYPIMEKGGSIINICSTRALMSEADTPAYSASKGGLLSLTHSLAVSFGPKIRVNAISPGWIETGPYKKPSLRENSVHTQEDKSQHPVGRVGTPEDVAYMVSYLLSDKSSFITGQNFVIDGGMTKKMIYV